MEILDFKKEVRQKVKGVIDEINKKYPSVTLEFPEENRETERPSYFIDVSFIQAESRAETFNTERKSGIIQIDIIVPKNIGTNYPDIVASMLVDKFKMGSKTGEFYHHPPSYWRGGLGVDNSYVNIVTVNYTNYF